MINPASTIASAAGPRAFCGGHVPEMELAFTLLVFVVEIIDRGAGAS
jgi:hypothetical protein